MTHSTSDKAPRIVVLGGGNGTSRLLTALLPLLIEGKLGSLHALVLNVDDGGSTGRLRMQYGVGAMGDLTRCLLALSGFHGDQRGEELLRAMNYRFSGGDFAGHTLRNIFLASLEKTSDLDAAIAMMARILQVPKRGGVIPATLTPLTQQVVFTDGEKTSLLAEGEHNISHKVNLQADSRWQPGQVQVCFAEGDAELNPRAQEVLETATHLIVAPGHTFGTTLPTLALPALGRTISQLSAEIIVVMTLLTTPQQTSGWTGEDFVRVYESYLKCEVDTVIANIGKAPIELVQGQSWVRFKENKHKYELVQGDIVSTQEQKAVEGDVVSRAVVIHDSETMRDLLSGILIKK